MNRDEFEAKVLEVWSKSRVPLTEANLQHFAGVSRAELNDWVDELLYSGVLDIDIEGAAELQYCVPGAQRSVDGPTSCEAYDKKRKLVEEAKRRILARRAGKDPDELREAPPVPKSKRRDEGDDDNDDDEGEGVASLVSKAALMAGGKALVALDKPLSMMDKPRGKGEKSLPLSAGLSLLGPVGWLYAGSFREAIPATVAYVAVGSILPSVILAPFVFVGAIVSGAIGLTYAWQYNRKKGRTPLFLKSKAKKKPKKLSE